MIKETCTAGCVYRGGDAAGWQYALPGLQSHGTVRPGDSARATGLSSDIQNRIASASTGASCAAIQVSIRRRVASSFWLMWLWAMTRWFVVASAWPAVHPALRYRARDPTGCLISFARSSACGQHVITATHIHLRRYGHGGVRRTAYFVGHRLDLDLAAVAVLFRAGRSAASGRGCRARRR